MLLGTTRLTFFDLSAGNTCDIQLMIKGHQASSPIVTHTHTQDPSPLLLKENLYAALFFQLTVKVIGLKNILLHQYRLSTHPEQLVQISALISPSVFFYYYLFICPANLSLFASLLPCSCCQDVEQNTMLHARCMLHSDKSC